jgi:hypothetical protein
LTVNVRPAIVIVPERAPPFVDAAVNLTVPLPDPLLPDVTVSHGASLVAVQSQPFPAVTVTVPLPPPAGTFVLVGEIENEQALPWFTVNVWSATVIEPERAPPLVAAALNCTVPLPEPLPPAVIVIHGSWLAAVQAQPDPLVTPKLPEPPFAGTLVLEDERANEHPPP